MSLGQDLDVVVVEFDVLALDGLVEFECFVVAVEFVAAVAVVVALVVFAAGDDSVTMLTEYVVFVTFVGYLRSELYLSWWLLWWWHYFLL